MSKISTGVGYVSGLTTGIVTTLYASHEIMDFARNSFEYSECLVPATGVTLAVGGYAGLRHGLHPLSKKLGQVTSNASSKLAGLNRYVPSIALGVLASTLIGLTPLNEGITKTYSECDRLEKVVFGHDNYNSSSRQSVWDELWDINR